VARIDDGLDNPQAFALLAEQTSARNLLAYGLNALRTAAFLETTRDPIMTMLSIGVEKLFKMALGLAHVAEHREWPPAVRFKNVWRHDLDVMLDELLGILHARMNRATHAHYVETMLEEVERDPALRPLIAALSSYGKQGRFYNLDLLAERPQAGPGPDEMWSIVEQVLIEHDDDLRAQRTAVTATDPAAQESFIHALEARTADSLERLWRLLAMAGVQGVLGDRGKGWGIDVDPDLVGRQIRS